MSYPKKIRRVVNRCSPIATLVLAHTMTALSFAQSRAAMPTSTVATAPALNFDVISIKSNKSGSTRMEHASPGDGLSFNNAPLFVIVMAACNGDHASPTLNMPDWTKSERYDIQVKSPIRM